MIPTHKEPVTKTSNDWIPGYVIQTAVAGEMKVGWGCSRTSLSAALAHKACPLLHYRPGHGVSTFRESTGLGFEAGCQPIL